MIVSPPGAHGGRTAIHAKTPATAAAPAATHNPRRLLRAGLVSIRMSAVPIGPPKRIRARQAQVRPVGRSHRMRGGTPTILDGGRQVSIRGDCPVSNR